MAECSPCPSFFLHISFSSTSPCFHYVFLSPFSQIVLMRDMSRRSRGRRCLLGLIFTLLCSLSFLFTSSSQTINGAPLALLRPTRQHLLRSIPVLSSLGRKDDVALFLSVRRRNSGKKTLAARKKTIIAVIRLSLGVSTFGQNCSPYAQHFSALQ